jgi:hypothetical protein
MTLNNDSRIFPSPSVPPKREEKHFSPRESEEKHFFPWNLGATWEGGDGGVVSRSYVVLNRMSSGLLAHHLWHKAGMMIQPKPSPLKIGG